MQSSDRNFHGLSGDQLEPQGDMLSGIQRPEFLHFEIDLWVVVAHQELPRQVNALRSSMDLAPCVSGNTANGDPLLAICPDYPGFRPGGTSPALWPVFPTITNKCVLRKTRELVAVEVQAVRVVGTLICLLVCIQLGCRSSLPRRPATTPGFPSAPGSCETVAAATVGETGWVEEYVQLGLMQNPRVHEAQHQMDALRHRIPQVLALPDPNVNTITQLAPVQTAAGEQTFGLGINQKFTSGERRATQAAVVSDEILAAEANLREVQQELAEQIRIACYQLLFIRQSIVITQADARSLQQIADVIVRQYEVKQSVTQQDVLSVQLEQSDIDNQLTELQQKEQAYQARLARLLHVDPRSQFTILDPLQSSRETWDVDHLIGQAIQSRPELQAQFARIQRGSKQIRIAQLENRPDLTLGLNWIATSAEGISPVANGDDALLLGVGFNLPIYQSRIRAGICEAQANRRVSQSKFEGLQDRVAEEVFDAVSQLDSVNQTLSLIQEDMIPKSQRTLDLSIDEYATGEIDYVQLITNWRNVLRYRIAEANLQSQYLQLLASLARRVGQLNPLAESPALTHFDRGLIEHVEPALQGDGNDFSDH